MACRYCGYDMGHAGNCPAGAFAGAKKPAEASRSKATGSPERYTGGELEMDLFDRVNVRDAKFLEALRDAGADQKGYLPYRKAMDVTKRFQPGDPANPKKDYFRELRIAVQEKLGVDVDKEPESVRAYTAVGTPLDKYHGVDAFMTFTEDGREYTVTMDATLRKDKLDDGYKADVMVTDVPSPEDDEDAYLEAIDAIAEKIAERFRDQQRPVAAE